MLDDPGGGLPGEVPPISEVLGVVIVPLLGICGAMPETGWMPFVGGTVDVGELPIGLKFGVAARPFAPIVFDAEAFVAPPEVLPAVAVGFGLALVGIVEFGRLAIPVDDPVLAQPVRPVMMTIPAHVPAVRMDIVTPALWRDNCSQSGGTLARGETRVKSKWRATPRPMPSGFVLFSTTRAAAAKSSPNGPRAPAGWPVALAQLVLPGPESALVL
jgi:hypothetical protein